MNFIKLGLATCAIGLAVTAPAFADRSAEVDQALRKTFTANDADGNGVLISSEIKNFAARLFARMDTNKDGSLSAEEFHGLSIGLMAVAQRHGRAQAYTAARERIRKRWTPARRKVMPRANYAAGAQGELFAVAGSGLTLNFDQFKRARFIRELSGAVR